MATHPKDLDLYVIGALDDERAAAVEAHVAECAECAAALAREARLELQLGELARDRAAAMVGATVAAGPRRSADPVSRRRPRVARFAAVAAAALALVAGAVAWWPRPARSPEPIVVACPFDESARACVDEARQHGLYVQFPAARAVPIYENSTGLGGSIASTE